MNPDASQLTELLRLDSAAKRLPEDAREWEHLLVAARDCGLCGILLETLQGHGRHIPPWVRWKLEAEVEHVAAGNRIILERTAELAAAFANARLDMMVLKGAALLLCLYDQPGGRPMCDVDLLIRPGDAERADHVLRAAGYRRGRPLLTRDFYPRFHYEADYISAGPRSIRLDVHVRPFRPLRYRDLVPEHDLWDGRRQVPIGTGLIDVPSLENLLIHLAGHAGFHGADRPLWLWDIQKFVTKYHGQIDWELVLRRLNEWRLTCAACLAFDRAEAMFGPFLGDNVRRGLRAGRVSWRDRLATWQSPRDAGFPLWRTLVDLVVTPSVRLRVGYMRAVLLPDSDHLGEGYGGRHRGWQVWAAARRALAGAVRILCRPVGAVRRCPAPQRP